MTTPTMDPIKEHSPLERSWTIDTPVTTTSRQELIDMVRKSGLPLNGSHSNVIGSYSEPSSPRKLLRTKKDSSHNSNSSSTLTSSSSEEEGGEEEEEKEKESDKPIIIISDDLVDNDAGFRQRSGSRFYHESFAPANNNKYNKPVTYIPTSKSAHQLSLSFDKKKKSLLSRIRHSFRSKTRPRVVSDKKWIDHEEDLDTVSKPSYFRHIGHVLSAGPGNVQTIQLNKPPHGKFGIYIAQGTDPSSTDKKSIFVTRFYQENIDMFYATLLRPGDEILAVNGTLVRDYSVSDVAEMLADCQTVQLTILPFVQ